MTALLAAAALAVLPAVATSEPQRISARAFDGPAVVEVRDLPGPEAKAAIQAALEEIRQIQKITDLQGKPAAGIARLNAAAGQGAAAVPPRLMSVLVRARSFCLWSAGAYGPLGGRLNELWGLRQLVEAPPRGSVLEEAVESAGCDHLEVDSTAGSVSLAAESRLDLWGFAKGFAVDRAVEILRSHGASNGWVEVARVKRGFGPGADGRGWRTLLPVFEGFEGPLDEIYLKDQSLAIATIHGRRLRIAGDAYAPFVNQKTGRPVQGVVAVVVVTELGLDAEGLATSLFVMGTREGQFRLGSLRPRPSVLWLLGSSDERPLMVEDHWSVLKAP